MHRVLFVWNRDKEEEAKAEAKNEDEAAEALSQLKIDALNQYSEHKWKIMQGIIPSDLNTLRTLESLKDDFWNRQQAIAKEEELPEQTMSTTAEL